MAYPISIRGTRALGNVHPPDEYEDTFPADAAALAKNLATYEAKRISLGIPKSGTDLIPEKSLPLEAGFDELNGVDFEKGCYVGQEVTARMKHRSLVKKRMFPVTFEEELASGTAVKSAGVGAGEILSAETVTALLCYGWIWSIKTTSVQGVRVTPQKTDWIEI